MASRHLVDPALLAFLDSFPGIQLREELLPVLRGRPPMDPPIPAAAIAAVDLQAHGIPGPRGAPQVGILFYRPRAASAPIGCILHLHGGGYVAGTASQLEFYCRPIAHELGCAIVSVEYRLAPETRFPGAIEDCYAALGWVFREAKSLGIDPQRIGVMGESAGGGLAASLALLARDRGEYRLAFQHLVYPMIDDRTCVRDLHPYAGEFVWTAQCNEFGWRALLGKDPGAPDVSAYAAAARAENLAGLPRTYIASAALDIFIEENLEYARRLIRAGVPTELHVHPGAYHAFDVLVDASVSQRARAESVAALARALA
jgi:triacylglycerol lipase